MRRRLRFLGVAAVILAAATLLYGRSTRNGALPEDESAVWSNPAVTGPAWGGVLAGRFYETAKTGFRPAIRPLPVLWHRLEWRIFHQKRAGYIWVRIALAALSAGAFLSVLRAHGQSWRVGIGGSLVLLAHPLTARSVLCLAGSADLLALFFGMISLLFLLRGWSPPARSARRNPSRDMLGAGVFLLLAVLSHEAIYALGAALLIGRIGRQQWYAGRRALLVVGGALGVALLHRGVILFTLPHHLKIGRAVESASGLEWPMRVLAGLGGVLEIARQLLLPLRIPYHNDFLMFSPAIWLRAGVGLVLLVALGAAFARGRRPESRAGFWSLVILLTCLGVCGLVVPTGSLLPARPLVFVLAAAIVLVVLGGNRTADLGRQSGARSGRRAPILRTVAATLVVLLLALRSYLLGGEYRSWEALVNRQTEQFRRSPQGWFDRGNLALARDRNAEAVENYEKALETWPEHWQSWVNLGTAYSAMDETGLAVRSFERALAGTRGVRAFRTVEARAHFNRALMLMKQVRNVEAAQGFENMLEVFPDHLTSHANLGLIYSNSEYLDDKSTMHLSRALEMETDPRRRQLLLDFLDDIQKRRARLERNRPTDQDGGSEFEPDAPQSGSEADSNPS